ncbi:MAG: tetratricopeptide repeat protein [Sedimentisphaerales bacterium]|nr:tetratricopeptide repeat protein [Sedimentisphaerales bacterium]
MKTILTLAVVIIASVAWPVAASGQGSPQDESTPLVFEYQGLVPPEVVDALETAARSAIEDAAREPQVHAAAYNLLGICYYLRGRYEPALENFDQAIDIEPRRAAFYSNRGIIHRRLGNFDQAQADYQQALTLDPQNNYAHNNLGWLLLLQSQDQSPHTYDPRMAEQAIEQLLDSQLPLASVNLTAAYLLIDDIDAARAALPDDDPEMLFVTRQCLLVNAGELARVAGNWSRARQLYEQAYELGQRRNLPPADPRLNGAAGTNADNPWILQRLGLAEYALADYTNAQLHLTMAAEIFNGDIAGRYAAIMAHLAQRHTNPQAVFNTDIETPASWIDALELYTAGRISQRRLNLMAGDDDQNAQAAKTCEMHFFIAQQLRLDNQLDQADQHLRQCVATGLANTKLEISIAAAQLQHSDDR